jgi:hypothetical protein
MLYLSGYDWFRDEVRSLYELRSMKYLLHFLHSITRLSNDSQKTDLYSGRL